MREFTFFVLITLVLAPLASAQTSYPFAIDTLAGTGSMGDGGPATSALLEFPQAVLADSAGHIYIADNGNGCIRVVDAYGTIRTLTFGSATSMKMDSLGNIYAVDGISRVYKISPSGEVSVFAGSTLGYSGDNGPATAATFSLPSGVAVDALGDVYVADTYNQVIRKITPDGRIQTVAGDGKAAFGKEGIAAIMSPLAYPYGVEVDAAGNIYISEEYRIRKVTTDGIINTIAGNGQSPIDGAAINSAIGPMVALAMDKSSNLYLADSAYNMVRMISSGRISTLAGSSSPGFLGDGQYGSAALLNNPMGVSVDPQGNVYIADENNHRIRKITATGIICTAAGSTHYAGDGGPATAALLHRPEHAIKDIAGNLYISDSANNRIRKVDTHGVITTIAGTGPCNYSGDSGPAVSAGICTPEGMAFDSAGNLYFADWYNGVIRRIDSKGLITTVAGNGKYADTGDGGTPMNASFEGPYGLAFDSQGDMYISDNIASRVRKVAGGKISTLAGTGVAGFAGDGGLGPSAQLGSPAQIAVGPDGGVYIADSLNDRVREVAPGGIITTVLGSQNCCANVTLSGPEGVLVDASGDLYVAWRNADVVTKTPPNGKTTILAGNGYDDFSGDGGLATAASFSGPSGLWQDSSGDLYVADFLNNRVRKLTLDTLTGMAIASGDAQSGNTGTALPNPLIVTLNFRGGVGIPGIPVTFAVTAGSATLSVQSTVTDSNGLAGVAVTLGNTPGPVTITASTAGVSSEQFHLTAISPVPLPTITAGGIMGAGGSTPPVTQLSPGGFATIFGSNFAPAGTFAQAQSSALPTQLAGVCVMVNGVPAFLTFVSPTQINFQAPAIPTNSTVTVQVIGNCGTANPLDGPVQSVASAAATPEFLYWLRNANGNNPVVAVNALTGAYIGAVGLISGLTFVPAKPGDILTIYGVSFGPTNPAAVPGTPPTGAAQSIYTPSVELGTLNLNPTDILYAGVSPGSAGLYQLNIRVPTPLPDGDYPLVLTLGTFATPSGGFLTVKN